MEKVDIMNDKNISKKLYELRKEKHLTQLQLAEILNVSDKTISKWETGASLPDIEMIKSICKTFNVKTSEFLEEVTKKPKKKFELKKVLLIIKNNFLKLFSIFSYLFFILFFINNYNTINMYELRADDGEITIDTGYFLTTNVKNSLAITNIRVKDLNFEVTSSKIKLYTFVGNNKKTYFYEKDKIDNILIEEISTETDRLEKNILKAIPKFLNIEIDLIDTNNKVHTYRTKLLLRKSYTNKSIIPKRKDNFASTVKLEEKPKIVDAAELSIKGFTKIKGANIYFKKLQKYSLYFDIESEKMYYSFINKRIEYNYFYKYQENILTVTKNKTNNFNKKETFENYEYYITDKKLNCLEGKCTDYLKVLEEVLTVFNDTLGIKQ